MHISEPQTLPFSLSSDVEQYPATEELHSSPIPDLRLIEPSMINTIRCTSPHTITEKQLPLPTEADIDFSMPKTVQPREKPEEPPEKNEDPVPLEYFQPMEKTRSKLFPQITHLIPGTQNDTTNIAPTVIVSWEVAHMLDFDTIFEKCRVITRRMKYVDVEISPTTAVILRRPTLDNIVSAITCFETVYLLGTDTDSLIPYIGHHTLKTRQFLTQTAALKFIRSLIETSPNSYVRDRESLHEHLLYKFPTITRTLAMKMLKSGNPIRDDSFIYEPYPQMSTYIFKNLLDMPSMAYYSYQASKTVAKRKSRVHETPNNESIMSYIPGVVKIKAPRPVPPGRV